MRNDMKMHVKMAACKDFDARTKFKASNHCCCVLVWLKDTPVKVQISLVLLCCIYCFILLLIAVVVAAECCC